MVASVVQITYICALSSSNDMLNSIWRVVVCGQVIQVTSIMSSTIPFLKPFLLSLESGFLSANNAARTTTSVYKSARKTSHVSSYIKINSQQSRNQSGRADEQNNIWVRKDVVVMREPSLELFKLTGKGS